MRCVKCGESTSSVKCKSCGFDFSQESICFLAQPPQDDIRIRQSSEDFVIENRILVKYTGQDLCPVIPDGIVAIAEDAFRENEYIEQIEIPEGVESIGACAFADCPVLYMVSLPESLKTIEMFAFSESPIEEIDFPAGLTSLGEEGAFFGTKLRKVTIPGGVKNIPLQAFSACRYLEEVILEHGVSTIEEEAFCECERLHTITIPDSVERLSTNRTYANEAFHGCQKLKTIHASAQWKAAHSEFIRRVIPSEEDEKNFEISGTSLLRYNGRSSSPVIPAGITEIGPEAFYDNPHIQSITLPSSVQMIGNGAFSYCQNLEYIDIPQNLSFIGNSAFCNCKKLQSITLPKGIDSISPSAFEFCSSLTELFVPGNVKSIQRRAFSLCNGLKRVVFAQGVECIEDDVFHDCKSLESVTIPDTIARIGETQNSTAFEACHQISTVNASGWWQNKYPDLLRKIIPSADERFNFCMDGTKLIRYWGRAENPIIPNGTTVIGEFAFEHNIARRLTLPDSIRKIERGAFFACEIESIHINENVQSIGGYAFAWCRNLKAIRLPAGITVLPEDVFSSCDNLEEVEIPGNVKEIGYHAFSCCSKLKKVIIRTGTRDIQPRAFSGCRKLTEITIPDTVTHIGSDAFEDVSNTCTIYASSSWKEKNAAFMARFKK